MKLVRLVVVAATASTLVAGTATASAHSPARRATPRAVAATPALARPRPVAVSQLTAYQDGRRVTLSWHNPPAGSFQHVTVRYRAGRRAPAGPRRGTAVRLAGPHATTATLRDLEPGTSYAAAVWTVAAGRTSARSVIRFRTIAPPSGSPTTDSVVSGTVTDPTGAPLAGVVVTASPDFYNQSGPRVRRSVTDAAGRYSLGLAHGPRYLQFDGSRATGGSSDSTGYLGDFVPVRLAARQHVVVDRSLQVGAVLRGRVIGANGHGIPGARVTPSFPFPYVDVDSYWGSFGYFEFVTSRAPRTGPHGYFRMPGLPEDSLTVCARAPHRSTRSACSDRPVLTSSGTIGTAGVIRLPFATPAGTIVGHVRDAGGFPVRGAEIFAEGARFFSIPHFGQTRADGSFQLSGLRGGRYDICVSPADVPRPRHRTGLLSTCLHHSVFVRAGRTSRRDAVLRAGSAVSGIVRGSDGKPAPNVEVSVDGRNGGSGTTTDSSGRFTAVGLPTGRYGVCTIPMFHSAPAGSTGDAPACLDHRISLRAGRTLLGAEVRLAGGGAINGRVAPSQPGRPDVYGFAHRIGPRFRGIDTAVRVRGGEYRLTGLRAGRYRVCFDVSWSDDADSTQCLPQDVVVRTGRTTSPVDLVLHPTGAAKVAVRDSTGRPIVGVDVAAVKPCRRDYECDHLPFFAATDPQLIAGTRMTWTSGSVLLDGLRPGHYAVCAFGYLGAIAGTTPPTGFADACSSDTFDVTVTAGQIVHRAFTLQTAGAVSGTVTDATGHPLQGVHVSITGSAATDAPRGGVGTPAYRAAVTGADGSYAVRSVAPGQQTVCFRASAARVRSGPVAVRDQCFGGQPGQGGGTPVTVASGQVTGGVDIGLTSAP